jgi:hypothetical protein
MPYQPRVQNRAGDIYAEGITQAGKYQAQGIYDSANFNCARDQECGRGFGNRT